MGRRKRANSVNDVTRTTDNSLRPSASASQPSPVVPDGSINTGSSSIKRRRTSNGAGDDDVIDAIAELHTIVNVQRSQIDDLRSTVERQQRCIDMLLAAFGLQGVGSTVVASLSLSSNAMDVADAADADISAQPSSRTARGAGALSFAAAIKKPAALVKHVTNAVVSAVYRDLSDKEHRASNIVISGLWPSGDDKATASHLLNQEFNTTSNVVKCRRLGKPITNRTQPLLVVLGSPSEASSYVSRAKELRRSKNYFVQQHVFINADITKAESLAAYQRRHERRERNAARSASHPTVPAQPSTTLDASAPLFVPSTSGSAVVVAPVLPLHPPPPPSSSSSTATVPADTQ